MKLRHRIAAACTATALLSATFALTTGGPAAAASNTKFCEAMGSAIELQFVVAFVGAFADIGTSSGSSEAAPGELTGAEATAVMRLMLAPKMGSDYLAAAKVAPKVLRAPLTSLGTYLLTSEKLLKKAGVTDAQLKKLRTLNIAALSDSSTSSLDDATGMKLSEKAKKSLAKSALAWSKAGDKKLGALSEDEELDAAGDKALAECQPTDGSGKSVKDACKYFTPAVVSAAVTGADPDEAEADDTMPLVRTCSLSADAGTLSLAIMPPKKLAVSVKALEETTKVKGVGTSALISDGSGSGSAMDFSGSTSGKTIWVTSKSSAFSLSLDKTDPDTSESTDVTDAELTSMAKQIAKQLKI